MGDDATQTPGRGTAPGTPGTWSGPAVGLLDLDAFFASVEQLDHPEWRGRPVIVGGDAERRGVVSTASYEARRFGVHSAMPSAEARRRCPEAVWTRPHFARYKEMSGRVMAILGDETPLVEQVSIDEAFFDVTPGRFSRESPVAICQRIQRRVAELGVTCSIGLGVSKTVAKVASEREKPRGLTVVLPGSEAEFLAPLPVRAMSGVGQAAEARLRAMGIRTLGQLAAADPERMRAAFGVLGPSLVERAAGRERSRVAEAAAPEERKSVSNERTFAHDLMDADEVRAAVAHLSGMVARRLRRAGLKGRQVTLKLKFDYAHGRTAQRQLEHATRDERAIRDAALALLDACWVEGTPVRLAGVGVSSFADGTDEQLSLFESAEDPAAEARERLLAATDELRERFGEGIVSYGHDLRFRDRTSGTPPMGHADA